MSRAEVWFDGACTGNPGPMGAGAVVRLDGREKVISTSMGPGTNNEAEYHGLLAGLRAAAQQGASHVVVHGDSQLVLRHLSGEYKVKAANLRPLYEEAKRLLARFRRVELQWVPRDQNARADQAARDAIA